MLARLEERTGRRVHELFDLIAGTSTGGILACALARPDAVPASELAALYVTEGPRIFDASLLKTITSAGGLLDERYEDRGLCDALERYLGDTRLSQTQTDVLCTAYDIEGRYAFFFRSERARADPAFDFLLRDAARATAAAPTYFEPALVRSVSGERPYALVDGGVYANNPAMVALTDVRASQRELDLLVSLGTGHHTRSYPYAQARDWGVLGWARPVLDVVFDGISDTTGFELQTALGERYVRLQCTLDRASDSLDDASSENLVLLREQAEELIRLEHDTLERVATALGRPAA